MLRQNLLRCVLLVVVVCLFFGQIACAQLPFLLDQEGRKEYWDKMPRGAAGHLRVLRSEAVRTYQGFQHSPCSLPIQELVIILHKALEAAQQEKRASSAYLAAAEDKDRLELVRHKVRQIAELNQRVETLEQDRERLVHEAGLLEQQVQELQQHVQLLMDKNQAKQQVICKLSQKLTEDLAQPEQPANGDFPSQQERIEHLKVGPLSAQRALLASGCHQWVSGWGRSHPSCCSIQTRTR